jgi:hypothetical protein
MARRLSNPRRSIHEEAPRERRVFRGSLAEDYDGIGQYVLVALAGSSVSGAYRARVASGDFGTGQVIPRGSPVTVFVHRGLVEILSLGVK